MSSSIPALERLFSLEGRTPEQLRLLSLLERLVTPVDPARELVPLGLVEDGLRVAPRELPARGESLEAVVEQLVHLMKGPASGLNVPGLIGAVATVLASGGEVRREEGLRADEAESRVAAMVSRLVGYDEARSAGRTLGSARSAVLAGLRVAIARHAPEARRRGVPRNLYCFAAEGREDALLEAVETTGIGGYHLVRVRTREDGTMSPEDLRTKMLAVIAGGDVPLFVVAAAGAEGSASIDDVGELREVADSVTSLYGLRPVHLHADAAWGGLYCVFNGYDFQGNPLGFEPRVLEVLAHLRARMRHLHRADSVGLDFRWLGRASFPAGLLLLRQGMEPGAVVLRSLEASSALALHAQLRAFGLEGYRRLLAEVLRDEHAARGGVGRGLSGVSTDSGSPYAGGLEAAAGLASGLAPELIAFAGARSPRVRPRN
jgi:L-2,4-diaminobutyrate decarboxylase